MKISHLKTILSHDNRLTVCPPGRIRPGSGYKTILVPSVMRSGTHMLIDLLLNNFKQYKRVPLYVNLDAVLDDNSVVNKLIECGGYIVKTHFPQIGYSDTRNKVLEKIVRRSYIISPQREIQEIIKSTERFLKYEAQFDIYNSVEIFEKYWGSHNKMLVPYDSLTDPQKCSEIIKRIGCYIGLEQNQKIILPPRKNAKNTVYFWKLSTRMLGRYSPIVNTTISFGK